jgi:hypothetical protein
MLSHINDAINEKLIQLRERFELLPYGVQAVLVLGTLAAVIIVGVSSGALSKGHPHVPFPRK